MRNQQAHDISDHAAHGAGHPGGLSASEHGHSLMLDSASLGAGRQTVSFRVVGPDGRTLTRFAPVHEKELHFIAIRRDMTNFQHVHPVMDELGRWRTDLDLLPGDWRFFADFQPLHHQPMTLGVDASVPGAYDPQPLPEADRVVRANGYTVSLNGKLLAGTPSELTFSVSLGSQPVTTLEPYLGAFGHLIALRSEDLAYLHVHPHGEPGDGITKPGPEISFVATAPSVGLYRLHLDFQHKGAVHTAQFTVEASANAHRAGTR